MIVCCRERVPAQSGETAEESSDVERRAAAAVASTLESEEPDNGRGYSACSLMKSSSISGSKCIGLQSKTDKEVSWKKKQRIFKGTWRWSLLTVVYVLCVAGHHS